MRDSADNQEATGMAQVRDKGFNWMVVGGMEGRQYILEIIREKMQGLERLGL